MLSHADTGVRELGHRGDDRALLAFSGNYCLTHESL